MDITAQGFQPFFLGNPEILFLINDNQPEIAIRQ